MSVLISEIDVCLNKLNFLDQNNPKIFTNKLLAQFAVSFSVDLLSENPEWSLTRA